MPGIGETLRDARRAMGVELTEVQERTKIRTRYLRALEEEDWDSLPGQAYARGFLRAYADFLGLESEALLDEYRRRHTLVAELQEPVLERAPSDFGRRRGGIGPAVALGVAAVLVFLLILGITGGSDEGTEPDRGAAETPAEAPGEEPPAEKPGAGREPSELSLTVSPVGTVWVCLVDDRGRELIDGETLIAGGSQGPFQSDRFLVTFGNGQVEMRVDGEDANIPAAANPLGYEVTARGVEELAEPERPTCT